MTKTVTFIALRPTEVEQSDGNIVSTTRLHTHEELVELVRAGDPGLFDVTEAHATQVLRPQRHYQEVLDDVLTEGRAPKPEPAKPSRSQQKRIRTQRDGEPDGSNDVART